VKSLTHEALLADPDLYAAIRTRAHRERAREFDRLIFSPAKALFQSVLNGLRRPGNPDTRLA
jgi:hypothetical protein